MDNLIENIEKQNESLFTLGSILINRANINNERTKLLNVCTLIKGFEVGSQNYIENNVMTYHVPYIRVGDLLSIGKTFVEGNDNLIYCSFDDILIAFDGAPGRNAIGIEGAFSSGIYKVDCKKEDKGLIYFELNSSLNQKIIKDHSQGTTILHASKALPFLEVAEADNETKTKLNIIFSQLVANKKKLQLLKKQKNVLLAKYF